MAKMERERAVKEKRAKKQERREERKAAAAREAENGDSPVSEVEEETPLETQED